MNGVGEMATMSMKIDTSDFDDLFRYVASVAFDWPPEKRERLRKEVIAALPDGIQLTQERDCFLAQPNAKIFSVLNRYGLNPVV